MACPSGTTSSDGVTCGQGSLTIAVTVSGSDSATLPVQMTLSGSGLAGKGNYTTGTSATGVGSAQFPHSFTKVRYGDVIVG